MVVCWLFVEMQISSVVKSQNMKKGYCSAKERIRQQASSDGRAAKQRHWGVAMFYHPSSSVACNNRAKLYLLKPEWAGCVSGIPLALNRAASMTLWPLRRQRDTKPPSCSLT
jgi:hypothetical protein